MSTETGTDLDTVNPYEGHQELTKLEAEVLWEYAKLAKNVKSVRDTPLDASFVRTDRLLQLLLKTRELDEAPDEALLGQLRTLERKMGLVLTLVRIDFVSSIQLSNVFSQFKASVWAAINDKQAVAEDDYSYDEDDSSMDRTIIR